MLRATVRPYLIPCLAALVLVAGMTAAACGQNRGEEETTGTTATTAQTQSNVRDTPQLAAAADDYQGYALDQAEQFVAQTGTFTDAVVSGDVEAAKGAYAPARVS